jgi:hypothetical protein
MFVFTELCFVTSHRHNTGVPAVHTVFTHVSRFLTMTSIAEITVVTAVFTPSIQNQSTHIVNSLRKKRQLREKLLFHETRRFITSSQGPANELYPEHVSYSHTQFLHVFPTTCPILRSWVKSRDMLVIITLWISTTAPWRLTVTAYLIVYNRRNSSEFLWKRKQYSRVPHTMWNFYTNWTTARFYVPCR